MFAFFDYLVDFFATVWQMITNMINGSLTAIEIVISSIYVPFALAPLVPGVIYSCIAVVTSIGVIKLILGWGNS